MIDDVEHIERDMLRMSDELFRFAWRRLNA
jgi:hypothetical protein